MVKKLKERKTIKELDVDASKKILNILLNICMNTSAADPIFLYEEDGKVYKTRAQVHLLAIQNFGTNKSGIIDVFPEDQKQEITEYTVPALCGTISREGMFVPGLLDKAKGITLVIDEAQNLTGSAKMALLSYLEKGKYQRSLGFNVLKDIHEGDLSKDYGEVHVRDNIMETKYRFTCLNFSTRIPIPRSYGEVRDAWLSRFVIHKTRYDIKDIMDMTMGRNPVKIVEKKYKGGVHFKKYKQFHKEYYDLVLNSKISDFFKDEKVGYLGRNLNDMARIACYYAGVDGRTEVSDRDMEKAKHLILPTLFNYLEAEYLTEVDYKILQFYDRVSTQEDLATVIGIDQAVISRHLKKLSLYGFI